MIAFLLSGWTACAPSDTATTGEVPAGWTFTVDGPQEVAAGEEVAYEAVLVDPDGRDLAPLATWQVVLSPLDGGAPQTYDALAFTPTVADSYRVTVQADALGEVLSLQRDLVVHPGEPSLVEIALSPDTVEAGASLAAEVDARDAWGNPVEDEPLRLEVDPPDGVTVDGASITPTVAGDYTVLAVVGPAVSDPASFTVLPGPAVSLDLEVDPLEVVPGQEVQLLVEAEDAWGNPIEEGFEIRVDPPDAGTVAGDTLTFDRDGSYLVTAALDGLEDTAGPVLVDGNGPFIELDDPGRGAWTDAGDLVVSGRVTDAGAGLASLEVAGVPVTPAADGTFSTTVAVPEGVSWIEVAAADAIGREADIEAGLCAGAFSPDGAPIQQAIDLAIGQDGLDAVADALAASLDPAAVEAAVLAANPLASASQACPSPLPGTIDLSLEATAVGFGPVAAGLVPDTGLLHAALSTVDPQVDLLIQLDACGVSTLTTGRLSASSLALAAGVALAADGAGGIDATVDDVTVDLVDLVADLGGLDDALAALGLSLADLGIDVEALAEAALAAALEPALEAAVEAVGADLAPSEVLVFEGTPIPFTSAVEEVEVDPDGLTLRLSATADAAVLDPDIPANPGSYLPGGEAPTPASGGDASMAISLDTVERLLHASWEGGTYSGTYTPDELGIDPLLVALLFPDASDVEITFLPQQAPVVTPGTGAGLLDLAMAEMQVEAWGTVGGATELLVRASVRVEGELDVRVSGGDLELNIGTLDASFDVHADAADEVGAAEALESVLDTSAASVVASLLPAVTIPLPTPTALPAVPTGVTLDGPDHTWLVVDLAIP